MSVSVNELRHQLAYIIADMDLFNQKVFLSKSKAVIFFFSMFYSNLKVNE